MASYIVGDKRAQTRIIAIVAMSIFMFSLDYSMLNISLPSIAQHFKVTIDFVSWLPLIYLLIVTSSLLGFGKLGDIKGHRRVFIAGLVIFLAGTIFCSLAPNPRILIAFRAFQSIGEAMFSPIGVAIITTFLPSGVRGRALGFVALAQGLGLMLGNVIGSYIDTNFVWNGIFLVNVPLCVITIVTSMRFLPKEQPICDEKRFDAAGMILIFTALACLVYALNSVGKMGLSDPVILGCLTISAGAFIAFIAQEKRAAYPLLDLRLLSNRDFTLANISVFCVVAMLIGTSFITPFFLQTVRKLSVMRTGVFLMAPALAMLILSPLAGRAADTIGSQRLCIIGCAVETAAFALLSFIKGDSGLIFIGVCMLLVGAGAGLFMAPNNRLVMSHVPGNKQGVASGFYKICMSTGSVLGIAILPLIIMRSVRREIAAAGILMSEARNYPELIAPGFRSAFIFAAIICVLAFGCALLAKDARGENCNSL